MKKNEKGAATIVIVLWSVILLTIFLAILLDLGKNVEMRNIQTSMAQTSAEYGIKTINSQGRIGASAVDAAIKDYKRQRNNPGGGPASNKVSDYSVWAGGSCTTVNVNGVVHKAPYFEATAYRGRGLDGEPIKFSINQTTGKATAITQGTPNVPYLRLDFTVHDSVRNMMLGVSNIIPGIDRDFNCQQITTKVSAVAFASQEDFTNSSGTIKPNN